MPVREDGILLFVLAAVDRQSFSHLPAPYCAFAAIQVSGDLLPGFQSFLWGVPHWYVKTPAEDYTRGYAARLRCAACQWKAFWMIFHPPGIFMRVNRSDIRTPEPAKLPDHPATSRRTTAMDSRMSTLTTRGSISGAGPFLSIQSKRN